MKRILTAGIVDYGIGNHGSLENCFKSMGIRTILSYKKSELDEAEFIVLPGVGAFSTAMDSLKKNNLVNYIKHSASKGKLIIGICLGAQLITESSCENGHTIGLGIIPGKIVPFPSGQCHIGWNELIEQKNIYNINHKENYYFNHSLYYDGPDEYAVFKSNFNFDFTSVFQKKNIVGIQFHPEKSQSSGKLFLKEVIYDFFNA